MSNDSEANVKEMAEKIAAIRQQAVELQAISGGIQAVDKMWTASWPVSRCWKSMSATWRM